MSSPAIIAKVRIEPQHGPSEDWLVPMWHADGPRYRSWVPLPAGARYEVVAVIEVAEPIGEISLDYTEANSLKNETTSS